MPYNVNRDSGFAERQSWMQIDDSTIPTLTGSEGLSTNSKDKRFAALVYTVNPSEISISGAEINIDTVGLDDSGTVKVSGDQLKVFDGQTINQLIELNIRDNYSRIIEEDTNGDVYFAHAPIGTSQTTSGWRIYKLDDNGNRSWAANGQFVLPATSPLSGHVFNY